MASKATYTREKVEIVELLKANPEGLTLSEIGAALNRKVAAGTLTGLVKAGFVEPVGVKKVETKSVSKRTVYRFVTADVLKNADGKDYAYTDSAKAILAAAAEVEGGLFTLADLSAAMNMKLSSGHINHLVKKGNIAKTDEVVKNESVGSREVNLYCFVADIPADSIVG